MSLELCNHSFKFLLHFIRSKHTMSVETKDTIRDTYNRCLTEQLSELELLKSMYPNPDEIIITDVNIEKDIQDFLDKRSDYTPNHLDYTVNIFKNNMKLELCVNLPTLYPNEEPDIYLRCNQLNRQQESKINSELTEYIKNNQLNEVCIYTAISWLIDNIDLYVKPNDNNDDKCNIRNDQDINLDDDKFARLWIYSHHIYNKKKREEIVKKAKELKLTGFCVPGKPGIICVEGFDSDCKEWWKDIKSMNWKKIVIRKTEIYEPSEMKLHQKFFNFEEMLFGNRVTRNSKHSDMSEFSKYLEDLGLINAFNEVFGFANEN